MTSRTSSALMGTVKYRKGSDFRQVLNKSLSVFFKDALRVAVTNPLQAYAFVRTVRWQKQAARLRSQWEQKGVHVPPIMIFSITNRCNLHCKGCYHWEELGISFMVIAGGEPLVRQEILDITRDFPEIIFLVFTNGLLINEETLAM